MDPRTRPLAPRQYEEFEPETSWLSEEGAETLLVHLPGFTNNQLRVQLSPSRVLKISGERLLGGNRWQRFMKEARVPQGCDTKEISAKFEGGVLYVRQPKLITPAEPQPKPEPTPEVPKPQPQQRPMPVPAPAFSPMLAPSFTPETFTTASAKEDAEVDQKAQEDANKGNELEQVEPRRAELEADTRNKYEETSRIKEELERRTGVAYKRFGGGIFKELKKPTNFKMVVVAIVVTIVVVVHFAYVNKVYKRHTTDEL